MHVARVGDLIGKADHNISTFSAVRKQPASSNMELVDYKREQLKNEGIGGKRTESESQGVSCY